MVNLVLKIISRIYNEKLESAFTRILYFFNTIDTYFLVAGISAYLIAFRSPLSITALVISLIVVFLTCRIADFYPVFLAFAIPALVGLGLILNVPLYLAITLLLTNISLFFIIQFLFMGIPDSIVARDFRVAFIKMYNSLFTVAPTTVSFSMSVFFSFYLSFCIASVNFCRTARDSWWLFGAGIILLLGALFIRFTLPKNHFSKFHKPDIKDKPLFNRLVILNIDGVRKDIFDSLNLPTRDRLIREGVSHTRGLETVYRALTNPAFASIITGTIPQIHKVRNNNFDQSIKTEGLPDIVAAVAYGSMHVKHFCKKSWETRIVSLPRHSIYQSDDIMVDWLKEDILNRPEVRLFIADFSEADFLAHAYGSKSKQYKDALKRIDKRIGFFLDWLETSGTMDDTALIICSDHGIAAIDHSYLIADSEKFVPFIMFGKGIKKGFKLLRPGKIMDICCTASYLLGVRYPKDCRGQVFTEALVNSDFEAEEEAMVTRFNQLKYDAEAKEYGSKHAEIYQGDSAWWDRCITDFAISKEGGLSVLDIGCGDGFVGERFVKSGVNFINFVCMDISENLLSQARKKLGGDSRFSFVNSLEKVNNRFDIVAASSLFHHMVNPGKISKIIDAMLNEGGVIIGSHEPNKAVFKNKFFYSAASLYKNMGGGISIDKKIVQEFNRLLKEKFPKAPSVCREEILQMVEYNSPIEQYDDAIDKDTGFIPEEFLKTYFPGYKIMKLETYTTFYNRKEIPKYLQNFLGIIFGSFFKEGNLFRFVLKKV